MTEIEANALPGTSRVGSKQTLTDAPLKATETPKSSLTHLPVLAGLLDPDFIKKPLKASRCPNSRITRFPVLAGRPYPGFIKTPIKRGPPKNPRLVTRRNHDGRLAPDVNRRRVTRYRIHEHDANAHAGTRGF